jgi:hypothetical protein
MDIQKIYKLNGNIMLNNIIQGIGFFNLIIEKIYYLS